MFKSGFFNSVDGDKVYNADDLSNFYLNLVTDGVLLESGDELKVSADSGLGVKVLGGWAYIKSKYLHNTETFYLPLLAADQSLTRIDRIILRLDQRESGRFIIITYKQGTPSAEPTAPELTRDENGIWELSLAKVTVKANATSLSSSNIVDERGNEDVCGYATFKGRYSFTEEMKTSMYNRVDQKVTEAVSQMSADSDEKIDEVLEKLGPSENTTEEYIDAAETSIKKSISDSSTAVTGKIDSAAAAVTGKIDGVESGMYQNNLLIKTWIDTSKTNITDGIETAKSSLSNSISTTSADLKTTVNNAKDNILDRIGIPTNNTVSGDIADVKTTISQDTSDIKTTVTNGKTTVMDKLGSSDLSIDTQLVNIKADLVEGKHEVLTKVEKSKSELSDELKALKEYIEDKHNETFDEMRKTKLEIIRACVDLADEMSPWRGVVSGRALEIPTVGICVKSYIYTAEEK